MVEVKAVVCTKESVFWDDKKFNLRSFEQESDVLLQNVNNSFCPKDHQIFSVLISYHHLHLILTSGLFLTGFQAIFCKHVIFLCILHVQPVLTFLTIEHMSVTTFITFGVNSFLYFSVTFPLLHI